jgi:hypothetical protein
MGIRVRVKRERERRMEADGLNQAELVRSNPLVGLTNGTGGYFGLLTKGFLRKFRLIFQKP